MMKIFTIIACLLVVSLPAFAGMNEEISHLLAFVKETNCQYERNGDFHSGEEAVNHISKKYDYFKDDINSAEDFIRYSATKSEFSGKHYKIHCPGNKVITSSDWLTTELQGYRAKAQE